MLLGAVLNVALQCLIILRFIKHFISTMSEYNGIFSFHVSFITDIGHRYSSSSISEDIKYPIHVENIDICTIHVHT